MYTMCCVLHLKQTLLGGAVRCPLPVAAELVAMVEPWRFHQGRADAQGAIMEVGGVGAAAGAPMLYHLLHLEHEDCPLEYHNLPQIERAQTVR